MTAPTETFYSIHQHRRGDHRSPAIFTKTNFIGDGAYDVPLFEKQQSLDKKFVGAISKAPLFVLKEN